MGIAVLNSKAFVVPHGSKSGLEEAMVYGTNPMAFAMPRPQGTPPLVWDQVRVRGASSLLPLSGLRVVRAVERVCVARSVRCRHAALWWSWWVAAALWCV